jgi:hypothetical protein
MVEVRTAHPSFLLGFPFFFLSFFSVLVLFLSLELHMGTFFLSIASAYATSGAFIGDDVWMYSIELNQWAYICGTIDNEVTPTYPNHPGLNLDVRPLCHFHPLTCHLNCMIDE